MYHVLSASICAVMSCLRSTPAGLTAVGSVAATLTSGSESYVVPPTPCRSATRNCIVSRRCPLNGLKPNHVQ